MKFYLDTSVFGGYYDPEFSEDTMRLFDEITNMKFKIVYSYLTQRELEGVPQRVRRLIDKIPNESLEVVNISEEATKLVDP